MAYVVLEDYVVARTTTKAVGVRRATDRTNSALIWIPRSVIEHGDDVDLGEIDLSVKEWFAIKEELEF